MNKTEVQKTMGDRRTLQEVVASMDVQHAKTGTYRVADVQRLVGDPVKGLGLSLTNSKPDPKK